MTKKEILYAAYKNEHIEDGLEYAIYLAGLLGDNLRVVLFDPPESREGIGARKTDIAYTEATQDETASHEPSGGGNGDDVTSIHTFLKQKCDEAGIGVNIHTGFTDSVTVSAVKDFMDKRIIDMVLVSPSLTKSGSVLRRLLKVSPRPVVTMAQ
jgi:hypothetical protein